MVTTTAAPAVESWDSIALSTPFMTIAPDLSSVSTDTACHVDGNTGRTCAFPGGRNAVNRAPFAIQWPLPMKTETLEHWRLVNDLYVATTHGKALLEVLRTAHAATLVATGDLESKDFAVVVNTASRAIHRL